MATKVYGIFGRTNAEISLPVGKATLPLRFERGSLDKKYFRPATFMTSKKYIQDMIENSNLFGTTIKLVKIINSNDEAKAKAAEARPKESAETPAPDPEQKPQSESADIVDFPEVTSREEAIEILKQNGAKATNLVSNEKIHAFMARKNITFSNFSF